MSLLECHPRRQPKTWPDPRFFAGAPTRDQAKRVWWHDLKQLTPKAWLAEEPRESELLLTTKWGAQLQCIGLDKPQRIEGAPWDGGVITEYADCRPGTVDYHVRPALADRKGWLWLEGVPDAEAPGQVEYKRRYDRAMAGQDPETDVYQWSAEDILDEDELESLRATLPEDVYDQEIRGQFVLASGLAFPQFQPTEHVAPQQYDPSLPLCWCLDFNINPMCSGIIQHKNGEVRVLKEFALRDTDTDSACTAFLEYCESMGWDAQDVRIYGDPAGHARDTTSGRSDWKIVQQRLANLNAHLHVPRKPWPIKDTLNAVRARLRTADGKSHIRIDPSCRRLINDLQTLLWPSDLSDGHCAAWLRYFIQSEYPLQGADWLSEMRDEARVAIG